MDATATGRTDPFTQALTAPGQPFEIVEVPVRGVPCRVYRRSPQCLTQIFAAAQAHGPKVLAVQGERRLTYDEAFAQGAALAAALASRYGVRRGTHVAIAMHNSPEWLVAFIAIASLGAVPVLVNSRGAPDELIYCVESTQCPVVIADAKRALAIVQAGGSLIEGVVAGDAAGLGGRWASFDALVAEGRGAALPAVQCDGDDPAVIMFTSGTTGAAKGAVLSHVGVIASLMANQFSAALIGARMAAKYGVDLATLMKNAPQPCTLLIYPLFHTSGCLSVFLTSLMRGGKIVLMGRWSAKDALRIIQDEKVGMLPGVPTMLWDLLHEPELKRYDTSSLNNLSTGGQALPINLVEAIREAFPQAVIGTGYGMTETTGVVSLTVGEEFLARPATCGRPVAIADVKVMDDHGNELPAGELGEICVRGAVNMIGYWNRPDANEAMFRDGWLRTGDIGRYDAEGFLYIVDRKKDMIISAGENIYCAEVERVLMQHPAVLEAATFGLPDARLGERLAAAVVLRHGAALDAKALADHCLQHLADYKVPRELRFDAGPLERNASGKIMKAQVRRRLYGA